MDLLNAIRAGEKTKAVELITLGSCGSEYELALLWATFFGQEQVVRALVKAGVDVDTRRVEFYPNPGATALILAAEQGRTKIAKFLIKSKASLNMISLTYSPRINPGDSTLQAMEAQVQRDLLHLVYRSTPRPEVY